MKSGERTVTPSPLNGELIELMANQSHCQSLRAESFCGSEQLLQSGYHPTLHDQNNYGKMSNINYCSPLETQGGSSCIYLANCQSQNSKRKGYEHTRENTDLSWRRLKRADFRELHQALNHSSGSATVYATRTQYGNGGKTTYLLPSRDPALMEASFTRTPFIMQSGGEERGKQRIRWTQELHKQFVEAVNSLGGAMKATPKGILGLMKSDGLTIFHIKSHLQKYRTTKCVPKLLQGNTAVTAPQVTGLKGCGGLHTLETLHMQMDVQRSLLEHLEFQQKLQLRMEANANYLERMFDQQKKKVRLL